MRLHATACLILMCTACVVDDAAEPGLDAGVDEELADDGPPLVSAISGLDQPTPLDGMIMFRVAGTETWRNGFLVVPPQPVNAADPYSPARSSSLVVTMRANLPEMGNRCLPTVYVKHGKVSNTSMNNNVVNRTVTNWIYSPNHPDVVLLQLDEPISFTSALPAIATGTPPDGTAMVCFGYATANLQLRGASGTSLRPFGLGYLFDPIASTHRLVNADRGAACIAPEIRSGGSLIRPRTMWGMAHVERSEGGNTDLDEQLSMHRIRDWLLAQSNISTWFAPDYFHDRVALRSSGGLCADIPSNTTADVNVQVYGCHYQGNQEWYETEPAWGPSGWESSFVSRETGKCLTASATNLRQETCNWSDPNQAWTTVAAPGGALFKNVGRNLCARAGATTQSPITMAACPAANPPAAMVWQVSRYGIGCFP